MNKKKNFSIQTILNVKCGSLCTSRTCLTFGKKKRFLRQKKNCATILEKPIMQPQLIVIEISLFSLTV
jgi:hypothetical protein